jgi:stage II sporulation protein D
MGRGAVGARRGALGDQRAVLSDQGAVLGAWCGVLGAQRGVLGAQRGVLGAWCGVLGAACAVVVALSACAPGPMRVGFPGSVAVSKAHIPSVIRVQLHEHGALVIREVPLEQYVETTILSELHPSAADEPIAEHLFEVQAVLARTYAVTNAGRHASEGFDLCSTTHCQLYELAQLTSSRWARLAHDAVRHTTGKLLWFGDQPARAVYHADCGGHTSDATAVWGGASVPYLIAAPDTCATEHSDWSFEARATALRVALNADARTDVGATLDRVEISGRDAAGRAELITLHGARTFLIRGEVFRDVVTRALGVKSIRSTLFSVKQSGDLFVFTGRGYGHGVGLCQAGAAARIRGGTSPADVLRHYFPGTMIRDP